MDAIRQSKKNIITGFVDRFKHLPKQGTTEWLAGRKTSVGGSEMAIITGDNPFSSVADLIARKTGLETFDGNINCSWGTLMEELTIRILTDRFKTVVYDCPCLPGIFKGQTYSPDGIMFIDTLTPTSGSTITNKICLLEIKNPTRRIPGRQIPKQYKPQVLTGLESIPICETALFVDSMTRRCSIKDLKMDNHEFCQLLHPPLKTKINTVELLAFIAFRTQCKFEELDLGTCNLKTLRRVMDMGSDGTVEYSIHTGADSRLIRQKLKRVRQIISSTGQFIVGILPVKIFRLRFHQIDRIPGYVLKYRKQIEECLNTVESIRDISNIDRRRRYFQKKYQPDKLDKDMVEDLINSLL